MLLRDGERLTEPPLPQEVGTTLSIDQLTPGDYLLGLDTGRELWTGSLEADQVIWASAYPHRQLPLAADTGGESVRVTLELSMMDGGLVARVYPGIEAGRLNVTVCEALR